MCLTQVCEIHHWGKQFVKLFQQSEPLVQILHDKLNQLLRNVMMKFLKFDLVKNKNGADLVAIQCDESENWLPVKEMDIGLGTRLLLSKVTLERT